MDKPVIVHLIRTLNRGGCENMLLRTLPHLSDFTHHLVVLGSEGRMAPEFRAQGISVVPFKLLFKLHPQLVITYLFHADVIGRLLITPFTRIPVVPFLRTTYNYPSYLPARVFEWLTKDQVKSYLANSQAVKNFYVQKLGVSTNKITVIPNGVDVDYFASIPRDLKFRRSLGIKNRDFVFTCVANYHPNKGHKYLIEAFNRFCVRYPQTRLLLVGKGIGLGERPDVPRILKISDCFVLPTLFEGMSNALMEAMAAGLPVITTDIPENRELVNNHATGVLVPPKDALQLQLAMEKVYIDKLYRNILGQNAQNFIAAKYSYPKIIYLWKKFLSHD